MCLEESSEVGQLEHELVGAELELESRQGDESLLLGLVVWLVAVVVGQGTGDHSEEGKEDDDLVRRYILSIVDIYWVR